MGLVVAAVFGVVMRFAVGAVFDVGK